MIEASGTSSWRRATFRAAGVAAIAAVAAAACSTGGDASQPSAPGGNAGSPDGGGPIPGKDAGGAGGDASADAPGDAPAGLFTLTSSAFAQGAAIHATYTCDGANDSPPVAWTSAPAGTRSFAIVMRDITLATTANYHWVIYDIPGTTTSVSAGVERVPSPTSPPEVVGAKQTEWSFGNATSYLGPCPPSGAPHTYEFTVYAFSTATIGVNPGETDPAAAHAVINAGRTASATVSGTFQR